ncbi:MAG: hypothetical protein AAF213_10985 [Pseudomonadota bacterium]
MRELFPNSVSLHEPSALVAPGPERPGWQEVKIAERPKTLNEILHKLHFESNNTIHPNGRINGGLDENGNQIAHFISPYAEQFWQNVEVGIQPVVRALKSKRYLTYSSCMGHSLSSRRYVGIAFADEEARERFCKPLEQAKIPGVVIRRLDKAANQIGDVTETGEAKLVKEVPEYAKTVVSFNYAFGREYEDYCFVELIICKEFPKGEPLYLALRHPILYGPDFWRKLLRWDRLTKRVAATIRSDSVPKYRY